MQNWKNLYFIPKMNKLAAIHDAALNLRRGELSTRFIMVSCKAASENRNEQMSHWCWQTPTFARRKVVLNLE